MDASLSESTIYKNAIEPLVNVNSAQQNEGQERKRDSTSSEDEIVNSSGDMGIEQDQIEIFLDNVKNNLDVVDREGAANNLGRGN